MAAISSTASSRRACPDAALPRITDRVHDGLHVPFVEGVVERTRPQGEAAANVRAGQERPAADLEVRHDLLVQQIQA